MTGVQTCALPISGGIVHHAGLRQIEDTLEGADRACGEGAVDAVGGNDRDGRVIAGNAV